MNLIQLSIKGISYGQIQSNSYVLLLNEIDKKLILPIIIGVSEAQSIVIALEKEIYPPRPLTHDLFKTFANRFSINIKQVIIHKLVDGVFFSKLICERDGVQEVIDARTSDAIALAVRFEAPIFTHQNILDSSGIYFNVEKELLSDEQLEPKEIKKNISSKNEYSNVSLKELYEKLEDAVGDENYELAIKIRDEINKRTQ